MAREIDLDTFAGEWADGAFVVDVREPDEYREAHVPGAVLAPLSTLAGAYLALPEGRPVYVICASGNRSKAGADVLTNAGADTYSVAGGTRGWARAGRPVVTGDAPGAR
ncbi:Sulfurtransferase [Streptomyces sp. RB5]|uniref:Sulfurtransferase n=1 Tax=Streptomyces smaragdinus TaxID=2585196 RepID=A0A7K0CP84_9ACTN|nr:rhodanese-like domain-containing protein [Streptomyces smaragdinus]MQY14564.1 Sulfurtransferase [Streptomyces smaragdinus]